MKEYTVETIGDFITAVDTLTTDFDNFLLWWRGQADSTWPLTPGIIRCKNRAFEGSLISRFVLKAKSRYSNCPRSDAIGPWLFLMQHYRLPTRLLDWSESPLVALYFAVRSEDQYDKDAAIWGLQPSKLNFAQAKSAHLLSHDSLEVQPLFQQAQDKNWGKLDLRTLAVQTEETDIRHLVQQSEFTIHGSSTPIENLPDNDKFLCKIIIPSSAKGKMLRLLDLLGITQSYLFPDLDNLSADIASFRF